MDAFAARLLAEEPGREAHFREALPLSTFDWNFNPAIPRLKIEALAQGDFIRRKQNLVFVGQSGLGKSRLIQSIGLAACMLEQRVYSTTSPQLKIAAGAPVHDRRNDHASFSAVVLESDAWLYPD